MKAFAKWTLIGGAVCVCAVLALGVVRRSQAMEHDRRLLDEAAADAHAQPQPKFLPGVQLPCIDARIEGGGIVVIPSNDTRDRQVVLDPANDHVVVEREPIPGGARTLIREVPLGPQTIAPGKSIKPIFIPIEDDWEVVRLRFERRNRHGVHGYQVPIRSR